MDPFGSPHGRLAYVALLILVRVTGKQSIRHGTTFQFVIALVIGDMVDNAIWAEVSLPEIPRRGRDAVRDALGRRVREFPRCRARRMGGHG